jgi:hypothetical protein
MRARASDARAILRATRADERAAAATAHLDAAMRAAGTDALTVPGARVTRTADGIAVTALPRINPDQLTVWSL